MKMNFYKQLQVLKKSLPAILAGITAGTVVRLLFILGLCLLFRLDRAMTVSLLPKSITTAIKNAWESLQRYGKQLWAEVDRNARVQTAEEKAERAERQTRADAITIRELTRRAERAENQAQEQEQYMRRQGIWQRFVQFLEAQRQQTHHHRR